MELSISGLAAVCVPWGFDSPRHRHIQPSRALLMSIFSEEPEMDIAYLKMGLYGEAGTGKTYTAADVARGLALYIEKCGLPRPSIRFMDTEIGSSWVKPKILADGTRFLVSRTRAFSDLIAGVKEADEHKDILIVDSITHFWQEVQASYLKAKGERLRRVQHKPQFEDYSVLKPLWGEFTTLFLNAQAHIILCGRSASIYEYQDNDETRKKELITVGTKMGAEKNMSYEPSLNVELFAERIPSVQKGKSNILIKCLVVKDRSDLLNGQVFAKPTFHTFFPHIKLLSIGGAHKPIDVSRTSEKLFPKGDDAGERTFQRKVVLDETQTLLTSHFPSRKADDNKAKVDLIKKHFGQSWTKIQGRMPLEDLRACYDSLHRALEGKPSPYAVDEFDDELPEEGGGEAASAVV